MTAKTISPNFQNKTNETGEFFLPKLPYAFDALEPNIDAATMELHYSKHHQTYVTKLNEAIKKHPALAKHSVEELVSDLSAMPEEIRAVIRNHGGGHANHALFWSILSPTPQLAPSGELAKLIDESFGSFEACKEKLVATATAVFGSGWAWLVLSADKKLSIEGMPNQDSPLSHAKTPLLGIDVWEHAYYLKYQNRRPEYLTNIFKVICWSQVSARCEDALKLS